VPLSWGLAAYGTRISHCLLDRVIGLLWWRLTIPAIRRFHDARHLLEEDTVGTLDLGVLIYSDLFLHALTLLDLKLLPVNRPPPRSQSWSVFFLRLHAIARPLHDLLGDM
jgi:hypothetical protein